MLDLLSVEWKRNVSFGLFISQRRRGKLPTCRFVDTGVACEEPSYRELSACCVGAEKIPWLVPAP